MCSRGCKTRSMHVSGRTTLCVSVAVFYGVSFYWRTHVLSRCLLAFGNGARCVPTCVFHRRETTAVSYNKLGWCLWCDSWVSLLVGFVAQSIWYELIIVRHICPRVAFVTGHWVGWDSRGPSLVAHSSILFSRMHRFVQSLDARQSS